MQAGATAELAWRRAPPPKNELLGIAERPVAACRAAATAAAGRPLRAGAHGRAQDFAPRRVTVNGAECRLLLRQARPVPISVNAPTAAARAPAARAGARPAGAPAPAPAAPAADQPAADKPVFQYEPFVNASGNPVPDTEVGQLVTPKLPVRGGHPAATEADQPVSISGTDLIGVDGQKLTLRGVNWCASPLLARSRRRAGQEGGSCVVVKG